MLGGKLLDRERNGRVVEANRHVDALTFEPAPRDGDANVGHVLVIISMGLPSTAPPASSAASLAAVTDPKPLRSA